MKKYITILFLYMSFVIPLIAQPDNEISFQGVLTNESGNAVSDGTYSISFSIYEQSSGGSAIWSEIQSVSVSNGVFSVYLGSNTDIDLDFEDQYWIGISVEDGTELSQRIKLGSSPYAMIAFTVPQNSINSYHIQTGGVAGVSINQMGASSGQALKWNGSQWAPADDQTGGITLPYYGFGNTLTTAFVIENLNTGPAIAGANSEGNNGTIGGNYGVFGSHASSNNSGYLGGNDYGVFGNYSAMNNWGALGNSLHGVVGRKDSDNDGAGVFGYNTNDNDITIINPQKKAGVIGLDYPSYNIGYLGGASYGAYGKYYANGNNGYLGGISYGAYAEYADNGTYAYLASSNYGAYGRYTPFGNYGYLGSFSYGVYGFQTDNNNFGYIGSTFHGVYGYNGASDNYGSLGNTSNGAYGYSDYYDREGYLGGRFGAYGIDNGTGNQGYLGYHDAGVYGLSNYLGPGVLGITSDDYTGYTYIPVNAGVYGLDHESGNYGYLGSEDYGVYGKYYDNGNFGALGNAGYGVYGYTSSSSGKGVYGINDYNGNYGYVGTYDAGVKGYNENGPSGALGMRVGVYGHNYSTSGRAIYGSNSIGWAGYFVGDVYVSYDLGIGTTSPSYDLHVVGNAAKTSGSYWISLSDGRLKDVKEEYKRGYEEISQLNPIVFSFKEDNPLEIPSDDEFVGIIAQDLEDIFPEALSNYGDGYLAFNAEPIFWALINAVKQQQEQINSYKDKFQQQEQKMDELIKMYDELLKRIDSK